MKNIKKKYLLSLILNLVCLLVAVASTITNSILVTTAGENLVLHLILAIISAFIAGTSLFDILVESGLFIVIKRADNKYDEEQDYE